MTLNDPRRGTYFRNLDADGDVIGAPYGLASSYALNSQPGDALEDPTLGSALMDYAEVEFLLADAAARGWSVGGSAAADHYDAAVTASIEGLGRFCYRCSRLLGTNQRCLGCYHVERAYRCSKVDCHVHTW